MRRKSEHESLIYTQRYSPLLVDRYLCVASAARFTYLLRLLDKIHPVGRWRIIKHDERRGENLSDRLRLVGQSTFDPSPRDLIWGRFDYRRRKREVETRLSLRHGIYSVTEKMEKLTAEYYIDLKR